MLDIAEYNEDFFRETGGFDDNLPEWIEEPQEYTPMTFDKWCKENKRHVLRNGKLASVRVKQQYIKLRYLQLLAQG